VAKIQGFPPISRPDAHTLILGSMPSRQSLSKQKYYAHPRNSFWPIMTSLLGISTTDYTLRAQQVKEEGIAIWDVLQVCTRHSSLDSDIDDRSMITNDFISFFEGHTGITRVFFNGAKAESIYLRQVLPRLPARQSNMELLRLPSTSPAHAGMTVDKKLENWRVVVPV
jgi:TDG/mug DNA glycosylase family protein